MRKNYYEDYYDAMQVCINGHYTTDSYHDSPKFRKKNCTTCGEKPVVVFLEEK